MAGISPVHIWRLAKAGQIPGSRKTKGGQFYFACIPALGEWIAARRRVKEERARSRKIAALRPHRTQIRSDFFYFSVPEEVLRRAFFDEQFIRARSLVDAPLPEDDLFAGLR